MSLPTAIERLNAHLIGFVRAYTFQLARGIEPQLPSGNAEGVDVPGHQAALQAARAIVRTARDKLDVRRMLSAMDSYLAGMGRDISEPFQRLIEELGDKRDAAATPAAEPRRAEPAVEPVAAAPVHVIARSTAVAKTAAGPVVELAEPPAVEPTPAASTLTPAPHVVVAAPKDDSPAASDADGDGDADADATTSAATAAGPASPAVAADGPEPDHDPTNDEPVH